MLCVIQKRQKNLLKISATDVAVCRVPLEEHVSVVNGFDKHRIKLLFTSSRRSLHALQNFFSTAHVKHSLNSRSAFKLAYVCCGDLQNVEINDVL